MAGGPVFVSVAWFSGRGSCPRRPASMSCPFVSPSYLLAIIARLVGLLVFSSRRASRCACLAPDVFFLCFFVSHAGVLCLLDLFPRANVEKFEYSIAAGGVWTVFLSHGVFDYRTNEMYLTRPGSMENAAMLAKER